MLWECGGVSDSWYVVMTRPNLEGSVCAALKEMSFLTFLPLIQRYREAMIRPLFPRYMFVCTTLTPHRWHMIDGVRGVVRLLGDPGEPRCVKASVMDAIMMMVGENNIFLETGESVMRVFRPGQSLEVVRGMFSGTVGVCTWVDKKGVRLEINPLLGRGLGLYVPFEHVTQAVLKVSEGTGGYAVRAEAQSFSEFLTPLRKTVRGRKHNPYRQTWRR
jgi:transcription antitermination factor NusG